MKYFKIILFATLAALFLSCEEPIIIEDAQELERIPEAELLDAPEVDNLIPEAVTVAIIKKDGYVLYFDAIDEGKEAVVIREKVPQDKIDSPSIQERNEEATPFDLFVSLTDKDVPVPQSIANMAEASVVKASGRTIDPLNLLYKNEDKELDEVQLEKACYNVGSTNFRNTYCGGIVESTNFDIRFCDEGTWTSHTRNSVFGGYWMGLNKISTSTNVLCGPTTMKFSRYEFWVGGQLNPQWIIYYQVSLPNGVWNINSHNPPSYTKGNYKKVRRTTNNGSFRAYTRFFSIY